MKDFAEGNDMEVGVQAPRIGTDLEPQQLADMFYRMVLIRRFDETALELRLSNRIEGVVHPYIGEEAVAVGVCTNLRREDRLVSTHRGHGHCIAKGANVGRMMAELLGKRDGYCKGKGGSMHIADFSIGMLGANGIVGGGLPIAAGSALAAQLEGGDTVTIGFFGDGSTAEGTFHESMNLSSVWQLPVVWVCENNQWGGDTPVEEALPTVDVSSFARAYNIPNMIVDGNDVLAVYEAAKAAVARARSGGGPTLLECKTFRWGVHAQRQNPVPDKRPVEQIASWKARDPIAAFEALLVEREVLSPADVARTRQAVDEEVAAALAFAEASPYPRLEEALEDVFGD
jgi:TPP-dependent pyruvate/acetoin dehydrogenase alpha subunit